MAVPLIMPKFEMSQSSATIVEWLKGEGDRVEAGEPVLIVETDKVTMEVESPATGILTGIRGGPDDVVAVTEIMAYVLRPGETLPNSGTPALPATLPAPGVLSHGDAQVSLRAADAVAPVPSRQDKELSHAPPYPSDGQRATPAARRIARERAIDLRFVTGSGPRGRVQASDVEVYVFEHDAAGASNAVDEVAEVQPLSGIRQAIAQRMYASQRATARVTLLMEADATHLMDARSRLEATVSDAWGFTPSHEDLLALIVARALREQPHMNVRLSADGESIELLPTVNLGLTVDTEEGLLVPVVRDAARKDLRTVATEIRALNQRAREGRCLPADLQGGTFTITSLGMYDVDAFTPIVNLPEVAVLGVGRIQAKPMVLPRSTGSQRIELGQGIGEIAVRQMWTLSLAFDHRLVDGAPAASFLRRVKELVEQPFLLTGLVPAPRR